jgi:outer membrane protein assembly factor BamB
VAAIAGCDGHLRLIDLETGKERAAIELGGNVAAAPAFDGRRFYVPTYSGRIFCVDLETRKIVWRHQVKGGSFYASAAVAGDRVIVAGRDKIVRCLRAADGAEQWRFRTRGRVDSSPVVVDDRVFVGSDDGRLYGLALVSGRLRWSFPAGSPIMASPAVGEGALVIGADDGAIYCFGERRR